MKELTKRAYGRPRFCGDWRRRNEMNYQKVVKQARADVAADRLIRGTYWNSIEHKGCFVGCLRHGKDHSPGGPLNAPVWFWRLCDFGHENCPSETIADNYIGIVEAVAVMKPDSPNDPRWQSVYHELMALMLGRVLSRVTGERETPIKAAIDGVIAYHRNPNRTEEQRREARSAAWSAAVSAAWSAAVSAAWSAAVSAAESAAGSAAVSAAWSAAEVQAILDDLKRLMREAVPPKAEADEFPEVGK